ncbi:hypothetical protein [Candidatus Nitrosopumilus sediminis]|uniref:RiboL-PSP-HEPN domain-containing protein n=1 Tax=Candidatus Nitrosopumilus sediminis TaxID=1229909 RepID=K0BC09_9ARCH|nr:hypothetical protein [Candidatus Nitrosopumilus sediminis]AFS82994.1 hypothetical protein NSED_05960 [Candidatus Nitrosopumilus sediminis]
MVDKRRGTFSKRKKNALFNEKLYPRLRIYTEKEVIPILEEIKSRKKNDKVRIALSNHLIVKAVSMFETFLLNQAYRKSKRNRKSRQLFSQIQTNATISDQIISSFSFMNLDDVNTVFSVLLGVDDYLAEIKDESVQYADGYSYEYAHIKYTNPFHKNWDVFLKIFDIRHDIVHNNKQYVFDYSEIRNFVGTINQFLMCSVIVVDQN